MTSQNPPPFHQGPGAHQATPGYPPPGYPPPGYPAPAYPPSFQPPAPKPPLQARQKSGARLAGILGFLLLSLGGTMFILPIVALLFGAFFALIFRSLRTTAVSSDPDFLSFDGFLEDLNLEALIPVLVIIAVVGVILMVVALFLSARVLRSHGIDKAWAVTWAGAGIAVVANGVVTSVLSMPFSLFPTGLGSGDSGVAFTVVVGIVGLLVSIVATAAVGWLSWWWMAHLMRPAVTSGR